MNEQTNLDAVRKGYEAFGRGDIPGLLRLLHDEVSWTTPGPAELPTAGNRTGHEGVQEFFTALTKVADILRFEPKEFIAHGDKVIVIGDDTSRVRVTGKSVEFRWVHIFELRDGKVASFEERGDVSALVAELRTVQASV
jgi:ketosteroid isomerase-like protein